MAFILDGNKRWAKKNNVSIKDAYKQGLNNIENLINNILRNNIPYLTLFTLSSENINRNSVEYIFQIIFDDFKFFFDKIINEKKVKIKVVGSQNKLPDKIIDLILYCENMTKGNNKLQLNLAFNYGFKDEIKNVLKKASKKKIDFENEQSIKELFFLGNIPDPDILIRTGGDKRLSNFIMYNLTYTEIFFIKTLWPDFSNIEFEKIINNYKNINRTYGL